MVKKSVYLIYFLFLIFNLSCGDDGDEILGTVDDIEISSPQMLADGVSSALIKAKISDSEGNVRSGLKVSFSTTHGSITESEVSDNAGYVYATLTSCASEVDIQSSITAVVTDTSDGLKKSNSTYYFIDMEMPGFRAPGTGLKKSQSDSEGKAELSVLFLGVSVEAKMDVGLLPADELSQAQLTITIKESSSRKAVSGAPVSLAAIYGTIPNKITTNDQGIASASLTSSDKAVIDSIFIEYGDLISKALSIQYALPRLSISPNAALLPIGGTSKQMFTATLISTQNTPIPEALISFETSNGTISPSSAKTDAEGKAQAELRSGANSDSSVFVIARFHELADTAMVKFIDDSGTSQGSGLSIEGVQQLYRDGITSTELVVTVLDEDNNPMKDATVFFSALYGEIASTASTDQYGKIRITYTPDVGETDATDEITVSLGTIKSIHTINLLGVTMLLSAKTDSLPADASSSTDIDVQLKLTSSQTVIEDALVRFSSDFGYIGSSATTNNHGVATAALVSPSTPGAATVTAEYGGFRKSVNIQFYLNSPQSFVLTSEPNFIWVKEAGNKEQTIITATVLGIQGQPIAHEVGVKFYLQNGPGGGEGFVSGESGPVTETIPIETVNGKASIGFRAGTKSGTAEIRAELVDRPEIMARTTNVTIRSGPPYIWIDPADPSNVITHMTVTLEDFNLDGWNNVREFKVGIYVGDKYNNPVEQGTTVYLTSTAGIITTDITTDERGRGTATLSSANPRPYIEPYDGTALAPHRIPNPNQPEIMLPISIMDFEGMEVEGVNRPGDYGENDGVAVIMGSTHGRDQNGNDAIVYHTNMAVFSGPVLPDGRFDVTVEGAIDTLRIGETAPITIRLYDLHGNPPGAGSSLKASTSAGKVSNENLMASKENYGYGVTEYTTILLNNLDPVVDEETMAEVSVEFIGNSVRISKSVYVYLSKE